MDKHAVAILLVAITGLLGGGYFVSVSALTGVMLAGIILYQILWKKEIRFAADLNFVSFGILVMAYLIVSLWAVDSGMALFGFVKFLPLLLFYIYISGLEKEREQVIFLLPLLGSIMTIVSFLMMFVPDLKQWVSVSGRIAGFFQYPNTYAMFMLVCLIIVIYRFLQERFRKRDFVYIAAAVFGIYMSGSRTVFVLTGMVIVWLLLSHKEARKLLGTTVCIAVLVIAGGMISGNSELLSRITLISFKSTTFLGRILYARDALPLILKHPLGLGYYGYYFMQQSIQTGVYSVVNVHNELLQLFLDVGVLPAILMCIAVIRSVLSRKVSERDRLILITMVLHSLFDYDFQFLVMGFVFILFLDIRNVKTYKVPVLTRTVLGAAGIGALVFTVVAGASDLCYILGKYESAVKAYGGNTMAEIEILSKADTPEKMRSQADALIAKNPYISVAYSARARASFSEGDVGAFIEDKRKAIALAPYQYEEYEDYLLNLSYSVELYLANGNIQDAQICVKEALEVPKLLDEVREKTSPIAWEIRDKPQVKLKPEHETLLNKMKEEVSIEERR